MKSSFYIHNYTFNYILVVDRNEIECVKSLTSRHQTHLSDEWRVHHRKLQFECQF